MDAPARRSLWLTIEAIALLVLGVIALFMPLFAGLALAATVGVLLIAAGLVGFISAFSGRAHSHRGWSLLSAAIALIIGLVMFVSPLAGAQALVLFLGAYLLLDGISLIGLALDHRKRADRGWGWVMASGIVDILLAAAILLMSALASAMLIGFILGLDLILAGIALLVVHRAAAGPPAP